MIKVLHVLTDKNVGGAGRWLLNELSAFDREKLIIKVILPEGSALVPRVRANGIEVIALSGMAESSWDKASLGALRRVMERERPDVVHTHASLTARVAARLAKVPVLVMTKHCRQEPAGIAGRIANGIVNRTLSDCVIAVSDAVGRQLVAAGTPAQRVVTVYNGIAVQDISSPDVTAALRKTLSVSPDEPIIGCAARLEAVKGVDRFIEMAKLLVRRGCTARFIVCGTGSEEARLHQMAEELGERIIFTGFVDKIEQVLAAMDVLVIPSRHEALCLTGIEALAMQTPVCAFDVDGVGEVVRDGETGLLVRDGDTDALAGAAERLLADDALRKRLGTAGRELVLREFDAQTMARKLEALYASLLEKKKGRGV